MYAIVTVNGVLSNVSNSIIIWNTAQALDSYSIAQTASPPTPPYRLFLGKILNA